MNIPLYTTIFLTFICFSSLVLCDQEVSSDYLHQQLNSVLSLRPKTSYFSFAVKNIPHFEKRDKGGEDAWHADDQLLVVLDGVGGWSLQGIDAGLFSKQLAKDINAINQKDNTKTLKEILIEAVVMNTNTGSSTAVMVRIDRDQRDLIKTTNLGDSGYMIYRPRHEITETGEKKFVLDLQYRSQEQQFSFNFPYQCGTGSPLPHGAFDSEHRLKHNDIVILGSDGMFDNLYNKDIQECVEPGIDQETLRIKDLQQIADCLGNNSETKSLDTQYLSPFAQGAREANIMWNGGKQDDITVVVAQFNIQMEQLIQDDTKNDL